MRSTRAMWGQFDPGQKHAFDVLFTENEKRKIPQKTEHVLHQASFCSVVVITCATHAQFEPGRKHTKYVAEPGCLSSKNGKILSTIFSRSKTSRHKFAHG